MKRIALILVAVLTLCSFTRSPFSIDGEKVSFRLNNYDLSPVKIKITNDFGDTVFSEVVEEAEVGKLFNFENAYPSTYFITIKDNGTTYRQKVEVK